MKSKSSLKPLLTNAALAGALAVSAAAAGASKQFPKEGHYAFTACFSGVASLIGFSKGFRGYSYELLGTNRSDKPGAIMDHTAFRCVGANTSLGGKSTFDLLCEIKDSDGDEQLARIGMDADGRQIRKVVAGTGKYEGMQMSGTIVPFKRFPSIKPGTFQACNYQTGTYELK